VIGSLTSAVRRLWASKVRRTHNANAGKGWLKNAVVPIRLQPLGAIRSSETGLERLGDGRQRTARLFFANCVSMSVR
jgi:hypothetical protein